VLVIDYVKISARANGGEEFLLSPVIFVRKSRPIFVTLAYIQLYVTQSLDEIHNLGRVKCV